MPMLVIALAGSASYVTKRPRIRLAWKTSFWLMVTLFLQTVLTVRNGSFAQPVRRHTTSNVSVVKLKNRSMPKDGPLPALLMSAKGIMVKRVTQPSSIGPITKTRSVNRVTKRVTIFGLSFSSHKMKKKFSKKGKGGKVIRTPEEKKKASSHAGQRLQQWKEEQMQEAERLWQLNDTLPPKERLSMRAIAKKVKIGKTTVIERLSGRRKGAGHIAGGQRQARVLSTGESSGSQVTRS